MKFVLDVDNNNEHGISFIPEVTSGTVMFRIFTMEGKKLLQSTLVKSEENMKTDISILPSGVYVLKIASPVVTTHIK